MEVSQGDLVGPVKESIPIAESGRGESAYKDCCEMLYEHYAKVHREIHPLTADMASFYQAMPSKILFCQEDGQIIHCAFIDENEIAYIATARPSDFHRFAQTLLSKMLVLYNSISFECDDCDPAAMELKAFFRTSSVDSYDTYILE